ncbi:HCLS1-binding protein 3 isoform X1 [Conger conger]|uniref:HCLS1-binding protein 3 isoform X1 n=1 Tax=Conger conger TaxID=82655 RepID=UPI002A5AEB4E|nr:HCLS1-binding protein 3 isoform X1 [Conger conger]
MPDGLVTSRPLQNEATGIDLQVPLFQEVRGPMMTGHVEYQIVVVTRLAAFKSAKHKPGDVVQLMVSKKYSDIDEFYSRLIGQYPKVAMPAMPRKALFVSETDIRDRRAAFDELVKFISKDPTLATCPELLEFLGAKTTDVADFKTSNSPELEDEEEDDEGFDFFKRNEPPVAKVFPAAKPVAPAKPAKPAEPSEEEEEEEEILDPLGIMKSKKPRKPKKVVEVELVASAPPPKPAVKPSFSLFDEEVDPDEDLFQPSARRGTPKMTGDLKLFEDPDLGGAVRLGDDLLLPTAYSEARAPAEPALDLDTDELFRVEEDLEKLLSISKSAKPKPALAPKPVPKPKPALPKKPTSLSQSVSHGNAGAGPLPEGRAESMGQMDILKYIQQNEEAASEDLDLF